MAKKRRPKRNRSRGDANKNAPRERTSSRNSDAASKDRAHHDAPKTRDDSSRDQETQGNIGGAERNHALDAVRGLAIVLMIIDHLADFVFGQLIGESWIRITARLAMPTFCILMGYFLSRPKQPSTIGTRFRWRRLLQIAVAAVLVNLIFYPHYERIEILGGLLLAYLVYVFAGPLMPWFVLAVLAYPVDPLSQWMDFPQTIVVAMVAQGAVLRKFGIPWAIATGLALTVAAIWIRDLQPLGVNHFLFWFVLPGTMLVGFGAKVGGRENKAWRIPVISDLGRYPLTAYVLQYYVIFFVTKLFVSSSS